MRRSLTNEFLALTVIGIFLVVGAGCAKRVGPAQQSVEAVPEDSTASTDERFDDQMMVQGEDMQNMGDIDHVKATGLRDIYFDFDRSLIRPQDKKILDENYRWLKADPTRKITIQGHADERGTSEYNLSLGERRAQAAKRYLINKGIEPHRIRTISYGEENPFCKERNEVCFQKNRRSHFVKLD